MTTIDVLLIESRPGMGRMQARELADAGHRVQRCYPPGSVGFPCVALDGGTCPLDDGVDVAVLAPGAGSTPTPFETGVSCALRAGIPVVATGDHGRAPFDSYLTADTAGRAVDAAEAGVESARSEIESAIRELAVDVLRNVDVDPSEFTVRTARDGNHRRVEIEGPILERRYERTLCVRAFDVLRQHRDSVTTIDVAYRGR